MEKNILVALLLSFCFFNGVLGDQVSCEKIENLNWGKGNWNVCYMDERTEINSTDTTIASRDESIEGLWFERNRKIRFLPSSINEKFPNLEIIEAASCSLTTISKVNFEGLSKLRFLILRDNLIENFASDVLDGLLALEGISLFGNKLKFIDGKSLTSLTKLETVLLSSNQCIDEDFKGPSQIAELQRVLIEKCPFNGEPEKNASSLTDNKCVQSQGLLEGIKAETSEVIIKLNELKTQQKEECGKILRAFEVQAETCKNQQTFFNEALEKKTSEIIDVNKKLSQAESQVMLKVSEIEKLNEELQRKNEEIIEIKRRSKS